MADIIFNYPQMQASPKEIRQYAEEYRVAANALKEKIEANTAAWTGASKNRFMAFVEGPVYQYTSGSIPATVEALAQLLEQNAEQMKNADQELANSLPTEL